MTKLIEIGKRIGEKKKIKFCFNNNKKCREIRKMFHCVLNDSKKKVVSLFDTYCSTSLFCRLDTWWYTNKVDTIHSKLYSKVLKISKNVKFSQHVSLVSGLHVPIGPILLGWEFTRANCGSHQDRKWIQRLYVGLGLCSKQGKTKFVFCMIRNFWAVLSNTYSVFEKSS